MALGDLLARLGGRGEPAEEVESAPRRPTRELLLEALDETEALVAGGAVPSAVTARVERVTHVVRDAIPRLDQIGAGSADAYAVMATATDYLPEAVGGYLRLPRRFADTRPVDGGKTALMVLVDQLDLLGATMDQVFDAVCRDDANALVVHGRFLAEKFGTASGGGQLRIAEDTPLPPQPPADDDGPDGRAAAPGPGPDAAATDTADESAAGADPPERPVPPATEADREPEAPAPRSPESRPDEPDLPRPARPSSLDL